MTAFVVAALALGALTLALLLRPWRRDLDASSDEAEAVRRAVLVLHREQLAELDRDLAAGAIGEAEHAQARAELRRRLLDDTRAAAPAVPGPLPPRRTESALVAVLPLAAAALYLVFGTPEALAPGLDPIDRDIAALAARLEREGGDVRGWLLLARSQRARGRPDDAERSYARAAALAGDEPSLLVEYADLLAERAGGALDERALQLVARALGADPTHVPALTMAATAAARRHDTAAATDYWRRLLAQLDPASEDAQWVRERLDEIGAAATAK